MHPLPICGSAWARHAFATILKMAGVGELHIKESMEHALGSDVTVGNTAHGTDEK